MYRCLVCCYENVHSFLHCIPKNNAHREKWMAAINRYDLIKKPSCYFKYYRVCGKHFSPDMYTFKGSHKLNTNAVPYEVAKSSKSISTTEAIDTSKIMSRDKKRCLVPQCTNDSHCAPNKYFVRFPTNTKLRQKWFESINVDAKVTHHAKIYVCEDHFSLEDDAENWMYFITIGSNIRLKKNVVPHRNIHQLDKDISISVSQISPSQKKRKQVNIEKFRELMFDDEQPTSSTVSQSTQTSLPSNVFATSTSLLQSEKLSKDTSFPKNVELSKKWVLAIKRENFQPNESTRICGKHFLDSDYLIHFGQRRLKTYAIPTIFDFPPLLPKPIKLRKSRIRKQSDPLSITEDFCKNSETVRIESIPSTSKRRLLSEDYDTNDQKRNKNDIDREAYVTERLQCNKTGAFEEVMIKQEMDDNEEYFQEERSNKSDNDREADPTDRLQNIKTEAFEEIMVKEETGDNSEHLQEYDHFLLQIKVEEQHENKLIIPDEVS